MTVTLPFSCPLAATSGGKDEQTATQGEGENPEMFIGSKARSGSFMQRAAKAG
jgi:hypothetical protein